MITELKKAVEKAEKLSKEEQRRLAQLLTDEMQWDKSLENSQEALTKLAQEALQEYQAGKTKQADW
ncbi:hypothetical protein [Tunicatimonas pelagia]|uniref:hypothetical protein n=1 Tax=Tunicatimonas pelagia TaxID=931531 RepID=UPI002664F028|nr:hypothetical protein [Tunicatimonas pelagia]WKN41805.1 hypothetical protein P0M28_22460 [Tunicatimonas pelagia]